MRGMKPSASALALMLGLALALPGAATGAAQRADAQGAAPLAPSGKWVVDYAEGMCTLSRTFGTGKDMLTFGLKPNGMTGEKNDMIIATAGGSGSGYFAFNARMQELPSGKRHDLEAKAYVLTEGKGRVVVMNVDGEMLASLMAASAFTVPVWSRNTVAIAPTGFASAMKALATCQDDLLEGLGVPRAEIDAVATRAEAIRPHTWIRPAEYPRPALNLSLQGQSTLLLKVSDQGRPESCRPVLNIGPDVFAEVACEKFMERGRYQPARNTNGVPIVSWTMQRVLWQVD